MSQPTPDIEKRYSRRADGMMPINLTLERDAVRLLRELAPGPKAHGRLVTRLIYEHAAREEVRKEQRQRRTRRASKAVTPGSGCHQNQAHHPT